MINLTQDFQGTYVCKNCETKIDAPKHCGKFMEPVDNMWQCWKGEHAPCCGKPSQIEITKCCDKMELTPQL